MARAGQFVSVILSVFVLLFKLLQLILPLFQVNVGKDFESDFFVGNKAEGVVFASLTNFRVRQMKFEVSTSMVRNVKVIL